MLNQADTKASGRLNAPLAAPASPQFLHKAHEVPRCLSSMPPAPAIPSTRELLLRFMPCPGWTRWTHRWCVLPPGACDLGTLQDGQKDYRGRWAGTYTHTHARTHARHARIHAHAHAHTRTRTHTRARAHTRTRAHTHAHKGNVKVTQTRGCPIRAVMFKLMLQR